MTIPLPPTRLIHESQYEHVLFEVSSVTGDVYPQSQRPPEGSGSTVHCAVWICCWWFFEYTRLRADSEEHITCADFTSAHVPETPPALQAAVGVTNLTV
jgi:hypothetical protein